MWWFFFYIWIYPANTKQLNCLSSFKNVFLKTMNTVFKIWAVTCFYKVVRLLLLFDNNPFWILIVVLYHFIKYVKVSQILLQLKMYLRTRKVYIQIHHAFLRSCGIHLMLLRFLLILFIELGLQYPMNSVFKLASFLVCLKALPTSKAFVIYFCDHLYNTS